MASVESKKSTKKITTTKEDLISSVKTILSVFPDINIVDCTGKEWGFDKDFDEGVLYVNDGGYKNSIEACVVDGNLKIIDSVKGVVIYKIQDVYYILSPTLQDRNEDDSD